MPRTKKTIEVKCKPIGVVVTYRIVIRYIDLRHSSVLIEEVIPGTRMHLKIPEVVQLPPLVSDTYMNLKLKHEAFFVPLSSALFVL